MSLGCSHNSRAMRVDPDGWRKEVASTNNGLRLPPSGPNAKRSAASNPPGGSHNHRLNLVCRPYSLELFFLCQRSRPAHSASPI
eukprot:20466-Prorocentrum_lima.AAC.1